MSRFPPLTFVVVVALGNQDSTDHRASQIANLFNRGIRRSHFFAFDPLGKSPLRAFGLLFLVQHRHQ
jgi:hypothetical protein